MQCLVKNGDTSLIDVENVETAGQMCLGSELTNTIAQFVVYVQRNEAPFTYIYVHHTNMYLRLTKFTKTLPQMSFHLPIYFVAIFISLWGSTHAS